MAKSLSKSNIVTNNTILASDVSQSIDALTGDVAYDIVISGSLETTGSVDISGLLTATSGITHQLTASNAVSSSFASTATSSSYADNVPAGGLPSGLLSSSAQIASDISGAFGATSASLSSRVAANEVVTAKTLVSSSAQIATEISGAFGAASASFSTRVSANEGNISTNTTNITTLTSKTGSYAVTGSNSFSGNQTVTGSLTVSGSDGILGNKLSIGEYGASGGSTSDELLISGSGLQRLSIESTDAAAGLRLKSPSTFNTFIDFEEGSDQRFIMGVLSTDDSFYLSTGSALVSGSLLKAVRATGDIEITHNISASAVSASTYYGDGSNLTGIVSGFWTGSSGAITREGDVEITGSLTVSGSSGYVDTKFLVGGLRRSTSQGTDDVEINVNGDLLVNNKLRLIGNEIRSSAGNAIFINNGNITSSFNVSSSATSTASFGTYIGDGSQLSNISSTPFPFTGDAVITGSLTISGSFSSFTLDSDNIVLGTGAGTSMLAGANNNVIIGPTAGEDLTSGDDNVLVGKEAGKNITTNSNNVILGNGAGATGNPSQAIMIGYQANNSGAPGSSRTITIGYQAGFQNTGERNISVGYLSNRYSSGDHNIALGENTNDNASFSGDNNIAIGFGAGNATSANEQINIGHDVVSPSTATGDIRIGNGTVHPFSGSSVTGDVKFPSTASAAYFSGDGSNLTNVSAFPFAGDAVITGSLTISGSFNSFRVDSDDIVLGKNAGAALQGGTSRAVLIGENAGDSLTTSQYVVGIGYNALSTATDGTTGTVAIGYRAGQNTSTGDYSVYVGYGAGETVTTGAENVALGRQAMGTGVIAGSFNVALGSNAGADLTSGHRNVFIGQNAGNANTEGFRNVFIGTDAGDAGVDTDYSIAIGDQADVAQGVHNQIAIGRSVATTAAGDIKIGDGNAGVIPFSGSAVTGDVVFPSTASAAYFSGDGSNLTNVSAFPFAGDAVITGSLLISGSGQFRMDSDDVVLGADAGRILDANTSNNVLIGNKAGYDITTGDNNVILGQSAGENTNADADDNIILGYQAGYNAISKNILIGTQAGQGGASYNNIIIGYQAGYSATSNTAYNVIIGYQAGFDTTGQYNTVIGYTAGQDIDAGDYNINIGYDVSSTSGTDNELLIGKQTTIAISADLSSGNVTFPNDVNVDGTLLITGSGTVLPTIESSDGIAALKLKSGGSHAYIDMDEGADQRWIAGMYTNDNSYRIASGSAFASNTIFELEQNGQARFNAGVEISGSITYPNASIVTYTNDPGTYTLTSDEHLVLIDAASGTVTINLPDAGTYPGREIHFKVTTAPGGNAITLQRQGSDTIDGATSNTSLDTQWEAISVISDGSSQWLIF